MLKYYHLDHPQRYVTYLKKDDNGKDSAVKNGGSKTSNSSRGGKKSAGGGMGTSGTICPHCGDPMIHVTDVGKNKFFYF